MSCTVVFMAVFFRTRIAYPDKYYFIGGKMWWRYIYIYTVFHHICYPCPSTPIPPTHNQPQFRFRVTAQVLFTLSSYDPCLFMDRVLQYVLSFVRSHQTPTLVRLSQLTPFFSSCILTNSQKVSTIVSVWLQDQTY